VPFLILEWAQIKNLKGAQMKPKKNQQPRITELLIRGFISISALSLALFMVPVLAHALTPVTVAWDANNPEPQGYILSWGTASGNYPNSKDVGNVTEYTIADLQEGVTYYFAAKAYDDAGDESAYSVEISHTVGLITHTIAASVGAHGSITPGGSVVVNDGASQTFTIVPAQDYQVLEVRVDGTLIGTATSHTFNNVTQDHTITASFVYVDPNPDSDGDGVPDAQDAFPQNPAETTDTDNDGIGNNADDDDDGDGMPDAWEIVNNLDPLADDGNGDPDGDGVSNLDEYTAGTSPYTYEDLSVPDAPVILNLMDNELVSLTPDLTTDEFYDPDIDDTHAASRWMIFRASDDFCVFDVTSTTALTSLKVPKLILEEDTAYTWKVKFKNNHDAESDWSDVGAFTTDLADHDQNGNGIPDSQEVVENMDLDNDGVVDSQQDDIKCVNSVTEDVQIGVSVKDSENVASLLSMEIEEVDETLIDPESLDKPGSVQFGLIDFKILVNAPGDETVVTIHLSRPAMTEGFLLKYDPINGRWMDYSDYAEFSSDRMSVYLTIKDGGFGDADGIENGIIVDPLTVGTAIGGGGSSGSVVPVVGDIVEGFWPTALCFISAASQQSEGGLNIWSEIRGRELAILFALILLALIGRSVYNRKRFNHGGTRSFTEDTSEWILF
jgi:hypothetical protein